MTRITDKLRFPIIVVTKSTTKFVSLSIAKLSLSSTFRLCKSVISKTLSVIICSMDDFFFYGDDFDLDYLSRHSRSSIHRSIDEEDDKDDREKLYLVPYRLWKEAQSNAAEPIGGVLYAVSPSSENVESEIVLDLRAKESLDMSENAEGYLGREYAFVPEAMWLRALRWYNDARLSAVEDDGGLGAIEDHLQDVFPIKVRLSVPADLQFLVVKIRLKLRVDWPLKRSSKTSIFHGFLYLYALNGQDNVDDLYRRACIIFDSRLEMLHLWDFSGQISHLLQTDETNSLKDSLERPREEILLKLHVHGFSDYMKELKCEMSEQSKMEPSTSDSSKLHCSSDSPNSYVTSINSSSVAGGQRVVGPLGLTGLVNLGNTCFLNSSIQCLVHTPELVDFFLGDYRKEINYENPLGMNGELALAFGDLLRRIWTPGAVPVPPRTFKLKLSSFAPQFSGYNQHDSQEFLAFLLDGLHEDLNRVKSKPYIEVKDADGRPDAEIADEYWGIHRARNHSIIVDLLQGQYRSTLLCPVCKKMSITFDPFMYLSLPLPTTTMRTMTLTVLRTDGVALPSQFTVTVPKCGRLKDLVEALSTACSLRNDETIVVAEIYKNQVFRLLDELSDSLALIRDADKLVAYRLPKDTEPSPLVIFMHQRDEKPDTFGKETSNLKCFGIPLVARMLDLSAASDIRTQFVKLLNPFLMPDDTGNSTNVDSAVEDTIPSILDNVEGSALEIVDNQICSVDFQFYMMDDKELTEIKMKEPIPLSRSSKKLEVVVYWPDEMVRKYDTCILSILPEVFKPQLFTKKPQESVSLYKCLEAFLKDEPLGPEDMWYCPSCQKPRQAEKKLDLWRLPEILVIHLKRFSYSRYLKNKLETYVDFPIHDLDLSNYISHKNDHSSYRYVLYATSNHYGGMGGGHYTAFVDHGRHRWYEFDDGTVNPISEDRIKTPANYVLFYRRVP